LNPLPTSAKDLLALLNTLAWPVVITKNKVPSVEKNFRADDRKDGRWLDGYWVGKPSRVEPNKGFGIHFVERDRIVWIGEYQGAREKERDSGVYSLILDDVQCYDVVDMDETGEAQSQLRRILKKPGAVLYSYFEPPASTNKTGPCFRMSQVKVRLQQSAFRRAVFERHGARCIITGCQVEALLDAAHLPGTIWSNGDNSGDDGIPLRVDLHRALDAELIRLDREHRLVYVDLGLQAEYGQYVHR
jgi:putative restriction endonuclease